MSTKLIPPPPPTEPIGYVTKDGRVIISQGWAMYLTVGLLQRLGGYNAQPPGDIIQMINNAAGSALLNEESGDEVMFVPGPPGPPGPASIQVVMLFDESCVEETVFIPR